MRLDRTTHEMSLREESMSHRIAVQAAVAAAIALIGLAAAHGQTFPNRPIKILVSQAAGGGPDTIMRLYADAMSRSIGPRVVIENRTAGGGVAAAVGLKQSPPDGYTLLMALTIVHTALPEVQKWPFDPTKDFEPIAPLYASSGVLLVPASSQARSMKDLAMLATSTPIGLSYGSPSYGSPAHLMGLMLQERIGAKMTHIPYRGGSALAVDFLAGQMDFTIVSYVQAKPLLEQQNARALAITGPQRLADLPDIPTLTEAGFAEIAVPSWFGIVAPRGTPADVVLQLREEFQKAAEDPLVAKRMKEENLQVLSGTAQDLARMIRNDIEKLGPLLKAYGIRAE
jgi:tripartite-type tricarboxylate transporter receptor subunit TctC